MSQVTHELTNANGGTVELTETARHRLLESDQRRRALAVLDERSQPLSLEDLATHVAEQEADADASADVETVATTLHHIHLPKMATAGIVEYDPETHEIVP